MAYMALYISSDPSFKKTSRNLGKSWFLKRTMVENNGETTPRKIGGFYSQTETSIFCLSHDSNRRVHRQTSQSGKSRTSASMAVESPEM